MSQQTGDLRIGRILIEQGVLSEQQVFEISQAQRVSSAPFGVLAERMFEVSVESVEEAWIEQYVRTTGECDLHGQHLDRDALRVINRRQAWQFEILPLCFEPGGELLIAASRHRLARAVTFAANRIDHEVYFRVANREQLRSFLQQQYPMPEITAEIMRRARQLADRA